MHYRLLVTPLNQAAFFNESLEISISEVEIMTGIRPTVHEIGSMQFLDLDFEGAPHELSRLATIAGIFECHDDRLVPLDIKPDFSLSRNLVYGAKYPGKTNESLTQLALNLAIHFADSEPSTPHYLLDPMAGRGTTLLWAARYGISADGIEADGKALVDFQREVKKFTKLDRLKHKEEGGQLPHLKKATDSRFSSFAFAETKARLIHGDSRELSKYVGHKKRYSLIVSDLPYGVQHFAGKDRSPLATLQAAAPQWAKALRAGGSMVLAFNAFLPKRPELIDIFAAERLKPQEPAFAHRVSESIKRELAIFTKA